MAHLTRADFSFGIRGLLSATNSRETEECEAGGLSEDGLGRQALKYPTYCRHGPSLRLTGSGAYRGSFGIPRMK